MTYRVAKSTVKYASHAEIVVIAVLMVLQQHHIIAVDDFLIGGVVQYFAYL